MDRIYLNDLESFPLRKIRTVRGVRAVRGVRVRYLSFFFLLFEKFPTDNLTEQF